MKNYEEKEKELKDALERLSSVAMRYSTLNNDIEELSAHKNQLISEKEENEKKYKLLLQEHSSLKSKFERIKTKLENQSKLNEKIDELNQETEGLIGEIEKW